MRRDRMKTAILTTAVGQQFRPKTDVLAPVAPPFLGSQAFGSFKSHGEVYFV